MSLLLTYTFCELPLLTIGGMKSAYIDGTATIEYDEDGEWTVTEAAIEGVEEVNTVFKYAQTIRSVCHQREPALFGMIDAALQVHEYDPITEAVCMQLVRDGTPLPSLRNEHGTLRVYQGAMA